MATFTGNINPLSGMSPQNQDGDRLLLSEWTADAKTGKARWTSASLAKTLPPFEEDDRLNSGFSVGIREPSIEANIAGSLDNRNSAGANWFEDVHVIPRTIELGNILTSQNVAFDVFNGFRYDSKTFSSFTNNAGSGISTSGLPSLPSSVSALDTVEFDVVVDTAGDPSIDGTLDVIFGGKTIPVPITGSRIVMFPYQPNAPLMETLEFLSEVMTRVDGTEQRISLRKNPRQSFNFTVATDNDLERQRISNLLFDWQGRVFGLPIWTESTRLTSDVSINDLTINVESTANADYRTGELAIVLKDDGTFDALNVSSTTATSITFDSEITNNYSAGDSDIFVMPLRTVFAESVISRSKQQTGVEEFKVVFKVFENDSDLASTTGWTLHPSDSKVILDGNVKGVALNVVRGKHTGRTQRRISTIDSKSGKFTQSSPWDRSKEEEPLNLFVYDRALLWDVRQLLHALRGKQVSFYLPTFFPDLTVNTDIVGTGTTMQVNNAGYVQFSGDRVPRDLIRLITNAGDEYIASVNSATEIDSNNESLSVTVIMKNQVSAGPGWPDSITVSEIKRVEFIQKVRLADDNVVIEHENADGTARIKAQVVSLFE